MARNRTEVRGVGSLLSTTESIKNRWTRSADATYTVGTNVEYAVYVEFGTSSMAAQPYLRPAAEQTRRAMRKFAAYADSLDEFLRLLAHSVERIAKQLSPVDTGNLRSSIRTEKMG